MEQRESSLLRAVDADVQQMCVLLSALVEVPTENPPGRHYGPCIELLERALETLGFRHERLDLPSAGDAAQAAVLAWVGQPGPTLYFHGHYDVVPAASAEQFVPHLAGDTLFGRGSSDMKSGLVAMMYAARALQTTGALENRGGVGLLFVPDEETGGAFGSAALASSGRLGRNAIGMLLPEPTSGVVWNANRGAVSLEVTVKGRAAHVGLQHQGVNAFERAVSVVARLLEVKREVEARRTTCTIRPVDAARSILLIGGRVQAGSNFNVVPSECRFTIDRRINPEEDFEVEKRRLLDVFDAARAEGIDLEIRTLQEGHASATPEDASLARILSDSIATVTGAAPAFELCPGLLEIRFYAQRGIPALAYGPGVLAVSHGPKEYVRISRMVECAKIYALTAARMFAPSTHQARELP